jgi:hypothetical protein
MRSLPPKPKVNPLDALGVYANAFRIVTDVAGTGPERCLLEFLVYSETEDLAQIVGRVLVKKGLLPVIRDLITEVL